MSLLFENLKGLGVGEGKGGKINGIVLQIPKSKGKIDKKDFGSLYFQNLVLSIMEKKMNGLLEKSKGEFEKLKKIFEEILEKKKTKQVNSTKKVSAYNTLQIAYSNVLPEKYPKTNKEELKDVLITHPTIRASLSAKKNNGEKYIGKYNNTITIKMGKSDKTEKSGITNNMERLSYSMEKSNRNDVKHFFVRKIKDEQDLSIHDVTKIKISKNIQSAGYVKEINLKNLKNEYHTNNEKPFSKVAILKSNSSDTTDKKTPKISSVKRVNMEKLKDLMNLKKVRIREIKIESDSKAQNPKKLNLLSNENDHILKSMKLKNYLHEFHKFEERKQNYKDMRKLRKDTAKLLDFPKQRKKINSNESMSSITKTKNFKKTDFKSENKQEKRWISMNTQVENTIQRDEKIKNRILHDVEKNIGEIKFDNIQKGSVKRVVLKLHPPSLGNMEISISKKDDTIEIKFKVQNDIVERIIKDNIDELEKKIKDIGLFPNKVIVEKTENFNYKYHDSSSNERDTDHGWNGAKDQENTENKNGGRGSEGNFSDFLKGSEEDDEWD